MEKFGEYAGRLGARESIGSAQHIKNLHHGDRGDDQFDVFTGLRLLKQGSGLQGL